MEPAAKTGKEFIIHLGLPKTGTTTLQNRIFKYHPDYLYLGRHNIGSTTVTEERDQWLLTFEKELVCKELPFFDLYPLNDILYEQFGDSFTQADKLFLSDEGILDRCMTPWLYQDRVRLGSPYHVMEKLKRVLTCNGFDAVKVILVVRKQDDLLESFFAEEYENFHSIYGFKSPNELADFIQDGGKDEEFDSLLKYGSFAADLDRIFGPENVKVLPFELMKKEPEMFLNEIATFLELSLWENAGLLREVKENVRSLKKANGKVARTSPLAKKLSFIKRKILGNVSTGLGSQLNKLDKITTSTIVSLSDEKKKEILDKYRDENASLVKRITYLSDFQYLD
jgi:hypothetical protein